MHQKKAHKQQSRLLPKRKMKIPQTLLFLMLILLTWMCPQILPKMIQNLRKMIPIRSQSSLLLNLTMMQLSQNTILIKKSNQILKTLHLNTESNQMIILIIMGDSCRRWRIWPSPPGITSLDCGKSQNKSQLLLTNISKSANTQTEWR